MTIAVLLSGDRHDGTPVADLTLEGQPVRSVPVPAVHGQAVQRKAISAAPGPHTVTVRFGNDAWSRTPETDRNLYVDEIAGVLEFIALIVLNQAGVLTFHVIILPDQATLGVRVSADLADAADVMRRVSALDAEPPAAAPDPAPTRLGATPAQGPPSMPILPNAAGGVVYLGEHSFQVPEAGGSPTLSPTPGNPITNPGADGFATPGIIGPDVTTLPMTVSTGDLPFGFWVVRGLAGALTSIALVSPARLLPRRRERPGVPVPRPPPPCPGAITPAPSASRMT